MWRHQSVQETCFLYIYFCHFISFSVFISSYSWIISLCYTIICIFENQSKPATVSKLKESDQRNHKNTGWVTWFEIAWHPEMSIDLRVSTVFESGPASIARPASVTFQHRERVRIESWEKIQVMFCLLFVKLFNYFITTRCKLDLEVTFKSKVCVGIFKIKSEE